MKRVSCSAVAKSLWVKSWKINNNRKGHFNIDSDVSADQVFMLLDTVQSDNEDEIDGLMNSWWVI